MMDISSTNMSDVASTAATEHVGLGKSTKGEAKSERQLTCKGTLFGFGFSHSTQTEDSNRKHQHIVEAATSASNGNNNVFPNPFLKEDYDESLSDSKKRRQRPSVSALSLSANSRYLREFKEVNELGSGKYSVVYKCRHLLDGCLYAVKRSRRRLRGASHTKIALREIHALSYIGNQCSNLIKYYSSWVEEDYLYTQTEWCNGGSLISLISRKESKVTSSSPIVIDMVGPTTDALENMTLGSNTLQPLNGTGPSPKRMKVSLYLAAKILYQMAVALTVLHDGGICHLDVKPDNIFVVKDDESIADVVLDQMTPEDEVYINFRLGDLGQAAFKDGSEQLQESDGRYMSRELLEEEYGLLTASDIFALGLSIAEVATGADYSLIDGPTLQRIREGDTMFLSDCLYPELEDIVKSMIHPDPINRPSAANIVNNPLFAEFSNNVGMDIGTDDANQVANDNGFENNMMNDSGKCVLESGEDSMHSKHHMELLKELQIHKEENVMLKKQLAMLQQQTIAPQMHRYDSL